MDTLRVLLIDEDPERASMVRDALAAEGHEVIRHRPDAQGLTAAVHRDEPDMVIIDMDLPDRDTLENMSTLNDHAPRPIVFFAQAQSDRDTIQAAVRAGVSAYVADGVQPDRVRSIVDTAVARFEAFQSLREELNETRTALAERKQVERAKGLIMKHENCDEDTAYRILRKTAMDQSARVGEIAQRVIELLAPEERAVRDAS
ncbi:response regulator receiver and ANTAR domain protein [Tamilnaduibacter salinus]|uniref:Response regulator receiver and ANTAR domain protein n=1 Tax=Tamilnaduibacter salinus TaxID=1484056 RepID=A0A2U1CY32_9GAMM|nr:ANTAR domain-containing protein [Tamilnaduibacter salinus]PVY77327.1 response regulator receiver and ANTAR domain protein [Tamilnaduibacter salinus]